MKKQNKGFDKSLKLIAKSSVVVFIGLLLSKVFTYIYRIIIARHFGPAEYGLFALAVMVTGWFIAFSSIGLNQGLTRYVSIFRGRRKETDINLVFRSSLKATLFASILAGVLLFISSGVIANNIFNEPGLVSFLKAFSIVIPLTVLLEISLSLVLAYEEIGWYSFIHKILIGVLRVVLIGLLILSGLAVSSIFISYSLAIFIALVLTFFVCKSKFPYIFHKKNEGENGKFLEVLLYSWPLLFYGIIWNIFHWTDSFLIGYFETVTEVGIYNAAVPIAFLLTAAAQIFMQLFFPIINKEYAKGNRKTVKQLSQQVGKWIFMINLPIFALLVLFPGAFLNIFFGSQYLEAANSLRFLSIGTLVFSVFNVSNRLIAMSGKSKTIFIDLLIVFVANVVMNILLIPKYGINGAAIATMISLIILSFIFAIQSARYISISPLRRKMLNLTLATIIPAALIFYIRKLIGAGTLSSSLLVLSFLFLYTLLTLVLKGLDKNDMMIIKEIKRKLSS